MAAKIKTISTLDINSGRGSRRREVHFIRVGKTNRKAVAQTIAGELYDHEGHTTGDFHIVLVTKVNGKEKTLNLEKDDIVFQTGTSNRWQAMSKRAFKKRFPEVTV